MRYVLGILSIFCINSLVASIACEISGQIGLELLKPSEVNISRAQRIADLQQQISTVKALAQVNKAHYHYFNTVPFTQKIITRIVNNKWCELPINAALLLQTKGSLAWLQEQAKDTTKTTDLLYNLGKYLGIENGTFEAGYLLNTSAIKDAINSKLDKQRHWDYNPSRDCEHCALHKQYYAFLQDAVKQGKCQKIEFAFGLDNNRLYDRERHALFEMAISHQQKNIVELFIQRTFNVNYSDNLLALAAETGNLEIAQMLLDAGACCKNQKALKITVKRNDNKMANLLRYALIIPK